MLYRYAHIARFLLKLLLIYAVWYVVYDLWILRDGRLDYWLGVGLAALIAEFLGSAGLAVHHLERVVWIEGSNGIEIADECTRLKMVGLFAGLVFAYPGSMRARAWFIPVGVIIIYAVNFWRLTALTIIQHGAPGYFDFAHEDLLPLIYQATVLGLWILWMRMDGR